jgi:hypothetical protein
MTCHLSSAQSCQWYLAEKFRTWNEEDDDKGPTFPPADEDYGGIFDKGDNHDDHDENNLRNLHSVISQLNLGPEETVFIPHITADLTAESEPTSSSSAGPAPQDASIRRAALSNHTLDDESDERVTVTHKNAGVVRRHVSPPVHSFRDNDGDTAMEGADQAAAQPYHPFHSDLDWRVAQWAIKDSPGQNALDRLLAVPGVSLVLQYFDNPHRDARRSWKNLGFHSTMSVHCIKRLIQCPIELEAGKRSLYLSEIYQGKNSLYGTETLLRQSKAFGKIPIFLPIWPLHPQRYTLIPQNQTAYTLKCGRGNGGMSSRYLYSVLLMISLINNGFRAT